MEHGIVPRPRIIKCPTAYCAPSQQGAPVAFTDVIALRQHEETKHKVVFLGRRRNESRLEFEARKRREGR